MLWSTIVGEGEDGGTFCHDGNARTGNGGWGWGRSKSALISCDESRNSVLLLASIILICITLTHFPSNNNNKYHFL